MIPEKTDGDGKPHRCSCGAFVVLCHGEYHDCVTERMMAHQKRQTEALETIARLFSLVVVPVPR